MTEIIDTREVGADLAPAIPDTTYRPSLVLAPDEARELVDQLQELQRSVLRQGVDYMKIPGTPNPSLLKPGAERLLGFFGLGHNMEQLAVERDDDGKIIGFFYRCTVTKVMTDGREVVVSACDGYCGKDEQKWRSAPINTVLKMAQKRALVGAALTATATSGLFTQDMEDQQYERPPRQRRQQPREHVDTEYGPQDTETTGRTQRRAAQSDLLSAAQGKKIHTLFTKLGVTDREARLKWTSDIVGRPVESSKTLTREEAHSIIEALESVPEA